MASVITKRGSNFLGAVSRSLLFYARSYYYTFEKTILDDCASSIFCMRNLYSIYIYVLYVKNILNLIVMSCIRIFLDPYIDIRNFIIRIVN